MKQATALRAALVVVFGGCVAACGGSGDESKIAFVRTSGTEAGDVYVMNADGSGQLRLTRNTEYDGEPAWSPDGRTIVFESNRHGNFDLFVMNPNGSGLRTLTRNPADDAEPTWSPDGREIVFDSNRDGNTEIYVMKADGSGQRRLARSLAEEDWPVWSPRARK